MERFKPHTYSGEQPADRPDQRKNYFSQKALSLTHESLPSSHEAIGRVKEVLSTIDQKVLFDIFREYYEKTGNNPKNLALTAITDIAVHYDLNEDYAGVYVPTRAGLALNAAHLDILNKDKIINTLIHEYVHEASTVIEQEAWTTDDKDVAKVITKQYLGVAQTVEEQAYDLGAQRSRNLISYDAVGLSINEGITQIIADDIHAEYVRRTGEGRNSYERNLRLETSFEPNAYALNQLNARIYIAFLSAAAGVPESTVHDAVVRTYFRNSEIVPPEFDELITSLIDESGLPFDELLDRILNVVSKREMKRDLNSEGEVWWDKFVENLPREKRFAFELRAYELVKNYLAAQAASKNPKDPSQ